MKISYSLERIMDKLTASVLTSALICRNAFKCVSSINKVKHKSQISREINLFRHRKGLEVSVGHVSLDVCLKVQM